MFGVAIPFLFLLSLMVTQSKDAYTAIIIYFLLLIHLSLTVIISDLLYRVSFLFPLMVGW